MQEEIIEGNKLIALFDGLIDESYENIGNIFSNRSRFTVPGYHKSFDWLMPVIDKIENMDLSEYFSQFEAHNGMRSNFMNIELLTSIRMCVYSADFFIELQLDPPLNFEGLGKYYPTRIEAYWNAVVRFIKWYNELKQESYEERIID